VRKCEKRRESEVKKTEKRIKDDEIIELMMY
jgi:hypothetical protein